MRGQHFALRTSAAAAGAGNLATIGDMRRVPKEKLPRRQFPAISGNSEGEPGVGTSVEEAQIRRQRESLELSRRRVHDLEKATKAALVDIDQKLSERRLAPSAPAVEPGPPPNIVESDRSAIQGKAHQLDVNLILDRAIEVIGDRNEAMRWLGTPVRALDYATPISLLGTSEGATRVEDVLGQMEHGVW